ncbi:MAG: response regulator transcription factor, partial [Candidatus Marinimicrobia bacterium]|nr:response regulator transcription factor [Candidatus Neomarinimicrobiota bacterium]
PILFLTALSGVDQKVMGLDSGGDDYLTKPFDIDELIARVNALVRRASFKQQVQLVIRSIKLDTQRLQVEADGTVLSLSNREFRLLEYLMRNAGRPLTRSQILEHVWDYNMDADSNMVDVYINYLRKKIDIDRNLPSNIETMRGYGYRFRDND